MHKKINSNTKSGMNSYSFQNETYNNNLKKYSQPWMVWLSGLRTGLQPKRSIPGLIPGQGICVGCGPGPQLRAYEKQSIDVSPTH